MINFLKYIFDILIAAIWGATKEILQIKNDNKKNKNLNLSLKKDE